jgi:hypothetical protein
MSRQASSCSLSAVYNSTTTIARSRARDASAAHSNARCCSSDSARGARLRECLALDVRRPETEKAVEVVDRRQREIHRRGLPAPLCLQPALEVTGGVVACPRIDQRNLAAGPTAQPPAIRGDVLRVGIPHPVGQRRPLQIQQVALKRRSDRLATRALLVSRRRFPRLRSRHGTISRRTTGRNRPLMGLSRRYLAAPDTDPSTGPSRRPEGPAAADHGQDPPQVPPHRDALRQPRPRSHRRRHPAARPAPTQPLTTPRSELLSNVVDEMA